MDLRATLSDVLGWEAEGRLPHGLQLGEAAQARFDADARRMAAFAASGDGKWLIELLLDVTLRKSPIDLSLAGEDARAYAAQRQGQNQVMAMIAHYLNHARQLETQDAADRRRSEPRPDLAAGRAAGGPEPDAGPGFDPEGFDRAGTVALR